MVQCGMCGFAVVHRATPGNAGLHSTTLRWCDVQSPHLRSCKVQFCVRAKSRCDAMVVAGIEKFSILRRDATSQR